MVFVMLLLYSLPQFVHADSVVKTFDSMDKVANTVQKQSTELEANIKEQEKRIAEVENAKILKVNYFWPLLGGAVAGITLAIIIRRKRKK